MGDKSLPQWQSHKKVRGDKIARIQTTGGEQTLLVLACGACVEASNDLVSRLHIGQGNDLGYYVRYADGFESWSPSKAFEEGYARIGDDDRAGVTEITTQEGKVYRVHLNGRVEGFGPCVVINGLYTEVRRLLAEAMEAFEGLRAHSVRRTER